VQPPEPVAQGPDESIEQFEGRKVREILVQAAKVTDGKMAAVPLEGPEEQFARNEIRSVVGAPFRARTVEGDLSRIHRLGRFSTASVSVKPWDDGTVTLVYLLSAQPIVLDAQPVNNRVISDQKIADVVSYLVGTPIDRFQIDRAARRVEDLYREKGYYLASVTVDHDEAEKTGIVYFRVREGDRIKVMGIRFEGNAGFSARDLRAEIKTKEWSILDKGRLDDDLLREDVVRLAEFYQNHGYLDVKTDRIVRPAPNGREAIVTFAIDEGPLYNLREVQVRYVDEDLVDAYHAKFMGKAGARPDWLSADQVRQLGHQALGPHEVTGLIQIKPGDVYSVRRLEQSVRTVAEAYGKLGYADVNVQRRELRDTRRPLVDLLLLIRLGPSGTGDAPAVKRFDTGEVVIRNNDITQHRVIRREMRVKPDRPLDTPAIEESRTALERLRLFQPGKIRITLQPPAKEEPDHRDVLVEVEETTTGEFNFGAFVGSDNGLSGIISFKQRNFDARDTPDTLGELFSGRAFRGAGQTFAIELAPGNKIQVYSISLSEPHLWDTDYSGTIGALYRTRIYRQYDETRYGFRGALGRRFGTRWAGTLKARAENVSLDNIDADAPVDYFEVQDASWVNGLGFELSRTSVDDRFRPTAGSRMELEAEQIFGEFGFTKLRAEYAVYLPVYETALGRRTVFSATTRINYIPEDAGETPVYERYFQGGQSFRGFDYRGISPRGIRADTGTPGNDPVGGTWSFFAGLELQQPIYRDVVSGVVFLDTGTVLNEPGLESYRVSTGVGIRLYVPFLSPAPLAFDLGFPLLKQDEDEERLFTFSIDIPWG